MMTPRMCRDCGKVNAVPFIRCLLCRNRRNAAMRKKRVDDPEYRALYNANQRVVQKQWLDEHPEIRARQNARQKQKRADDPEYRAMRNAKQREYLAIHPEINATNRQRKIDDPEYRAHVNARERKWLAEHPVYQERARAAKREKYANDPELRARTKESGRQQRADPEYEMPERKVRIEGMICPGCGGTVGYWRQVYCSEQCMKHELVKGKPDWRALLKRVHAGEIQEAKVRELAELWIATRSLARANRERNG